MEKYPGATTRRSCARCSGGSTVACRARARPEVGFAQAHRPGEAAQTDFTSTTELGRDHRRAAVRAPAVRDGAAVLQLAVGDGVPVGVDGGAAPRRAAALFQLGRVPRYHQTDNSTAATHQIARDAADRTFNEEYLAVMRHFGMKPRTTEVGAKEQNGDVEASNGAIKRRLEQALLVRGSRDFASGRVRALRRRRRAQGQRGPRPACRRGPRGDAPARRRAAAGVHRGRRARRASGAPSGSSTARTRCRRASSASACGCGSTKTGSRCTTRASSSSRASGSRPDATRIDYRHVIWSLVRKPGAFARYVYREEMFPSVAFRRAYDAIQAPHRGIKGDVEYLRILHLAASTLEADVEAALAVLLAEGAAITADAVKARCAPAAAAGRCPRSSARRRPRRYDALLAEVAA